MGKYEFIGLNFDDTDRDLKPGDYVDSLNLIPPKGGVATSAQRENIKGNLMVPNPHLPTGENRCIGTHEDSTNNRLIFFIWNSNNKHGIYQYLYETNKIEKIFEWEGLKFERDKVINGIDSVGDLLYWTDNIGLRQINISRPPDTTNLDERGISLYKTPPTKPPIVERVVDPNFNFNYISDKNFQFAYRYTYKDNEVSVLSPYSKLSPAETFSEPYSTNVNKLRNLISVGFSVDPDLIPHIKSVELFCRDGNNSQFYQFKSISEITESNVYKFYNNESKSILDDSYAVKQEENIPTKSSSLTLFDNILFASKDEHGFYVDESAFELSITKTTKKSYYGDTTPKPSYGSRGNIDLDTRFFKNGGKYIFGVAFYDEYNKRSSVVKTVPVDFDIINFRENSINLDRRQYVKAKLTGTPPSWASRVQILRTKELYYSQYAQYPVNLLFYIRKHEENIPIVPDTEFEFNGYVYTNQIPSYTYVNEGSQGPVPGGPGNIPIGDGIEGNEYGFNYIHLQIPQNAPFIPDTDCYVRILNGLVETIEPVIKVIGGEILVVKNFDYFPVKASEQYSWGSQIMVEVFKINKTDDTFFYEIGEVIDIVEDQNGNKFFPSNEIEIYGDTFMADAATDRTCFTYNCPPPTEFIVQEVEDKPKKRKWWEWVVFPGLNILVEEINKWLNDDWNNTLDVPGLPRYFPRHRSIAWIESPSRHFSGHINIDDSGGISRDTVLTDIRGDKFIQEAPVDLLIPYTPLYRNDSMRLDYSLIASDIGRPNVSKVENIPGYNPTTIVFSDVFVDNSLINGLNSFSILNEYSLHRIGGDIKKLAPMTNVILAIQERETTSLYINEGFINTGDGQQFLSKTANVIGDDRKLQGGYGTINPESVVQYNGKVYYFDMNKGEVLRYAENGLTPLAATYKAKSYFTQKSRERLKHKEQAKVYGAYHPYLDMYILTFAAVGEYPAETIAFSEKDKRWITRFSFAPEMYGKINTELVSFYKGNLWVHERNEVRNSFYGTSNNSEIEFVANDHPDYEKKFDNITLDASEPCDVEMSNSKGQVTDLIASEGEFKELGGNWYANILRDKNTPQIELGSNETPLHHGDEIISNTLKVKIKNNNNLPVTINNVKIGYKATSGQHLNEK